MVRRVKPREIWSNNRMKLVGAKRMLATYYRTFIETNVVKVEIQWHFNPPSTPNLVDKK